MPWGYVPGIEEDEQAHALYHEEWAHGCAFPGAPSDRILAHVQGMELLEAGPEDPRPYRKRFWKVALRAGRDTQFGTQYDGGDEEARWDGRAYALRREHRAVAFAVVRQREDTVWWSWSDYEASPRLAPQDQPQTTIRRTVEFTWVLPALQRRGVGSALIRAIAEHLAVPVMELGWTLGFTPAGSRLVRRLTNDGFWAS